MQINNTAKVVLVNSKLKQILLIKRSSTDTRRPNQWDIPGGGVEPNELIEQAVIRECKEECSIAVSQNTLKLIYTIRDIVDNNKILANWLIFSGLTLQEEVVLSYEHQDYKWVDIKQAIKLITYDRQKLALELIYQEKLIPELFN